MEKNDDEARTVVAKLRCLDHRGETVHTRWGHVTFDRDGLAELEVPEDELPMLRAIRPYSWLAEDHTSYQMALRGEGDPDVEVTTEPTFDVDGKRIDGPTIEEWVQAGYLPENYPPNGYAVRPSAALDAYLGGGEVPWDTRKVELRRLDLLGHHLKPEPEKPAAAASTVPPPASAPQAPPKGSRRA